MIILLLALFVIALIITIAGFLLTPKSNQPIEPRTISYATRGEYARRSSYGYGTKNVRLRRSVELSPRNTGVRALLAHFNVGSLWEPRAGQPTPWAGVVIILVAMFGIGLVSVRTFLPNSALVMAASWSPPAPVSTPAPAVKQPAVDLLAQVSGASKALMRVGQLDTNQYNSSGEYDTWAMSACSAAAMTEIINAYGHNYRVTDILTVESNIHEITPDQGLLEPIGVERTVAKFGFKTVPLQKNTLDEIISVANQGHPVIVGFPPDRWAGGHILIVRGGDAQHVFLADSSRLDMQVMTREKFSGYWGGYSVVAMPKDM